MFVVDFHLRLAILPALRDEQPVVTAAADVVGHTLQIMAIVQTGSKLPEPPQRLVQSSFRYMMPQSQMRHCFRFSESIKSTI